MPELKQRPVIGVTGPDHGGLAAWIFSALAIYRAGGRPKRIRPCNPASIAGLSGLIIGGGVDLDPALYGGENSDVLEEIGKSSAKEKRRLLAMIVFPLVYVIRRLLSLKHSVAKDPARDSLEISLVRDAVAERKPVLGICRGAQMLNAALGGSLHREIRGFYVETPYAKTILPRKKIIVVPKTLLASVWPLGVYRVNSLHHQAVDRVAPDLRIAAREENGLVQAVEHLTLPFFLGVQWHPEYLPHVRSQQAIFHRLVDSAREGGQKPVESLPVRTGCRITAAFFGPGACNLQGRQRAKANRFRFSSEAWRKTGLSGIGMKIAPQ